MPVPLLQRMHAQADAWERTDDQRCNFLRCYALMSENMMNAIEQQRFLDGRWVEILLRRFADYYFDALELFELQHHQTPEVWRETHTVTTTQQLHILQYLLLGINVHINYDLALTLYDVLHGEWLFLSDQQKQEKFEDHCRVNTIIAETIDLVQDTIIERQDPRLQIIDSLLGRVDEWMLSRLISGWRQEVWKHAQRLLAAKTPEERETIRQRLEQHVLRRALQIMLR